MDVIKWAVGLFSRNSRSISLEVTDSRPVTIPAGRESGPTAYKFDAFISYRRADATPLALWLRRRLRRYKLPTDVIAALRRRGAPPPRATLEVYVDSVFSRVNDDFWERQIVPSLRASRSLIVISTPAAFRPHTDGEPTWLWREIDHFIAQTGPERIFVLLGPGAPTDRFPGRLGEIGTQWDWADLRRFSWRRYFSLRTLEVVDQAFVKLVASLHDVPTELMPALPREEQRRRTRLLLGSLSASVAVLVMLLGLTVWALVEKGRATENFRQMLYRDGQRLAALANAQLEVGRPDFAVLVAREAFEPWREAGSAVERPFSGEAAVALTRAIAERPIITDVIRFEDGLQSAEFDTSGDRILVANERGRLFLIHQPSGRIIRTWLAHEDMPHATAFSPNGTRVLTAAHDGKLKVWNVGTGELLLERRHRGPIRAASYDRSGTRITTASDDGTVVI